MYDFKEKLVKTLKFKPKLMNNALNYGKTYKKTLVLT